MTRNKERVKNNNMKQPQAKYKGVSCPAPTPREDSIVSRIAEATRKMHEALEESLGLYITLERAMTQWDEVVSLFPGKKQVSGKRYLADNMAAIAERAARLSAYCEVRGGSGMGDLGHDEAVAAQNRMATKVRKALGFTQAKNEVQF